MNETIHDDHIFMQCELILDLTIWCSKYNRMCWIKVGQDA